MNITHPTLRALAIRTGAAFALASTLAFAQPGPHPEGGPGGIAGIVLQASVHTSLALTAAQEAAWQQLKADAEALHTALDTSRQAVEAAIKAELAKTTPDLVAIEDALSAAHEADEALIKAFREKVIAFYQGLTSAQKAVVIAAFVAAGERGPHR